MTEGDSVADREQPGCLRIVRRRRPDAEPLGRAPEQQRIPYWLGGRELQQLTRVLGQRLDPADETLLDTAPQRLSFEDPDPAGELCRRQALRQLEQCQRIAARLGDDPVAHAL